MLNNNSPTLQQLVAILEAVVRDAPSLPSGSVLSDEDLRWLGRAEAAIETSGAISALAEFRAAKAKLGTTYHSRNAVLLPLHTAYSRMELLAPIESRGVFIPPGDTWNGYAALVKLLEKKCDDLLIIDPYLSASLFIELIPHCVARKTVRCLANKRNELHGSLSASARKWSNDRNTNRLPVEVRYAPQGALHDRLFIFDSTDVWLISQSLKDIAKRSPAYVSHVDEELGRWKGQFYNDLWSKSLPV